MKAGGRKETLPPGASLRHRTQGAHTPDPPKPPELTNGALLSPSHPFPRCFYSSACICLVYACRAWIQQVIRLEEAAKDNIHPVIVTRSSEGKLRR